MTKLNKLSLYDKNYLNYDTYIFNFRKGPIIYLYTFSEVKTLYLNNPKYSETKQPKRDEFIMNVIFTLYCNWTSIYSKQL